jgi:hypothetical protein
MGFDFNHPFTDTSTLPPFEAIDSETFKHYGRQVLAVEMTNSQYDQRYQRLGVANNMRPPPSHHRIFPGYLVVRRPGQADQYETWMPDHVFIELYVAADS